MKQYAREVAHQLKSNSKTANSKDLLQIFTYAVVILTILMIWMPAFDPINLSKATIVIIGGLTSASIIIFRLFEINKQKLLQLIPAIFFILYVVFRMFDQNLTLWRKLIGTFTRSNGGLVLISFVFIMLALALSSKDKNLRYWRYLLLITSSVEIPYALLQVANLDPIQWNYQVTNKLLTTLGNPNFSSALFGILGAAVLPLVIDKKTGILQKILWGVTSISCLVLSYATNSIQGPVAMIGGLAFVGFLLPFIYDMNIRLKIVGILTMLTGFIFLLTAYIFKPLTFDKIFSYTFDVRKHYWAAAIKMIQKEPIFGVGIDSFGENYRLLRGYNVTKTYSPYVYTNNAHNVPLQIGATLGLIGLILYLMIQIIVLIIIIRLISSREQILNKTEIGLIAAWVAFQLQNLVSVDQIGIQVIGWCMNGIFLSYLVGKPSSNNKMMKNSQIIFTSILFLCTSIFATSSLYKDVNLKNAMLTPYDPNSPQSVDSRSQKIYKAAQQLSQDATYVALAAENIYQTGQHDLAIKLALENVKRFPETTESLSTALVLLENENRWQESYALRKKMQKSDPFNWENLFILAQRAEKLSFIDEARHYYQEVELSPANSERKKQAQDALRRIS